MTVYVVQKYGVWRKNNMNREIAKRLGMSLALLQKEFAM